MTLLPRYYLLYVKFLSFFTQHTLFICLLILVSLKLVDNSPFAWRIRMTSMTTRIKVGYIRTALETGWNGKPSTQLKYTAYFSLLDSYSKLDWYNWGYAISMGKGRLFSFLFVNFPWTFVTYFLISKSQVWQQGCI